MKPILLANSVAGTWRRRAGACPLPDDRSAPDGPVPYAAGGLTSDNLVPSAAFATGIWNGLYAR
jgi:hypothetical protein